MKQRFKVDQAGFQMNAAVETIGQDLLVKLTGGDHPHIGTISTYQKDGTGDVLRFPSHSGRYHKDDVLAEVLFKEIADQLPGNLVITSGVHIDGITQEQIAASFKMAKVLGKEICAVLKDHPIKKSEPSYKQN